MMDHGLPDHGLSRRKNRNECRPVEQAARHRRDPPVAPTVVMRESLAWLD
jgi:hypothetical protein